MLMKSGCLTYLQSISTAARNKQSHINQDNMLMFECSYVFSVQPLLRSTTPQCVYLIMVQIKPMTGAVTKTA